MTREEAIKVLQRERDYVQQAIQKATDGDGYVSPDGLIRADDYVNACTAAISALRQQEQELNEPMTNADRIRSMNDEELADFLAYTWATSARAWQKDPGETLYWLHQPAEEDDHEAG